jgi:hypothetical protein
VIDKLNRGAMDEPQRPRWNAENTRWLGYGAVLVLYGAVVTGALLVRARSRRTASRPNVLDLAVIAAGILGVLAIGDRVMRKKQGKVVEVVAADEERFSHPALNVQRISFA